MSDLTDLDVLIQPPNSSFTENVIMAPINEESKGEEEENVWVSIGNQIKAMGSCALAAVSYPEEFMRVTTNLGHYKWAPHNDPNGDVNVVLFGQVMPRSYGTDLSAKGTFKTGTDSKVITDDVTVRNLLVLGRPTNAPPDIGMLFDDQIGTLNEIHMFDENEEANDTKQVFASEWLRCTKTDPSAPGDLIAVHSDRKYIIPNSGVSPNKANRVTKRRTAAAEEVESVDGTKPTGDQISLNATYAPDLLEDHHRPLFAHVHAWLQQLDWCDVKENLIPPWDMYDKLRPGTIVLVNATLHCWVFSDGPKNSENSIMSRTRTPIVRKTYQVIAKSVRVLVESTMPAERPIMPPVPPIKPAANDAQVAFKNFRISPSKRQKLL